MFNLFLENLLDNSNKDFWSFNTNQNRIFDFVEHFLDRVEHRGRDLPVIIQLHHLNHLAKSSCKHCRSYHFINYSP